MVLRNLPPHEQRERWMTAIASSFHRMTMWRWLARRQVDLAHIRLFLDTNIHGIERAIGDLWLLPRAVRHFKQILKMVDRFYQMTQDMMDWLRERQENWRQPVGETREQKEKIIKTLVVLNAYTTFSRDFGTVPCINLLNAFPGIGPVSNAKPRGRRWSCDQQNQYPASLLENRCYYEQVLGRFLQVQEAKSSRALHEMHRLYDNGKLFELFVAAVQKENQVETDLWRRWGKKSPYPDYQLKDLDASGGVERRGHAPLNGVPPWDEDPVLQHLLA